MDMDLGVVGSEKTNTHAIRVGIREFKEKTGVDVRRWYKKGDGSWGATPKGVWLQLHEVKETITLLERAEAELTKNGVKL